MGLLEMAVSAVSIDKRDVVGGLEGRLVEGREGAARVSGLELRDSVVAALGFGEIEAAQFVVQDARVGDGEGCLAGGKLFGEGECGLLLVRVERDRAFCSLPAAVTVTDWKAISAALRVMEFTGSDTRTSMDSTPVKAAALRSGVRVSV